MSVVRVEGGSSVKVSQSSELREGHVLKLVSHQS